MWFPASTTITVWYNHALQSQLLSSRSIPSTLYSIVVRLESLCCCWNFWDITCIKYTQQLHFNFFFHLKCLALSLYCDMLGDHFNFTSASLDLARHKIIHKTKPTSNKHHFCHSVLSLLLSTHISWPLHKYIIYHPAFPLS